MNEHGSFKYQPKYSSGSSFRAARACLQTLYVVYIVLIGISRARNMNYLVINKYINGQQLMVKCIDLFYCIFVEIFVYIIGHHKNYNSFGNNEKILISVKNVFKLDMFGTKIKERFANDNTQLINTSTHINELKQAGNK
eukprot:UN13392